MPEKGTRRLAAIMFADMMGYTALMQEDEDKARDQRDIHRNLALSAVEKHNGKILQYYGDGTLSIFSSAVEAVECAVEIQLSLAEKEVLPLRIGVHAGDIVHDEDGVYGDGVNLASRIEGIAAPGGIAVSGKVYDEIKNHPSLSTVSLGSVQFKNVEHPVSVFAISNEGLNVPEPGTPQNPSVPSPTPSPGPDQTFLQGIKDRAMVQWALAYLGGAWAILEMVGFASDQFSWPSLIPKAATLLAAAGFFLTLILAWYHGESGRQRVSGPELILIAVLLALTGGALAVFGPDRGGEASVTPETIPLDNTRPSIAVLPLLNMSAGVEAEAAFLAIGLHDDLLTQLSKIASVDVIARTSVMQYAQTQKTVPTIGRELGVTTVLEGSVLLAGSQMRLNVQLIDTRTGTHLWAETYDREFTVANVFEIQSDLAHNIVRALEAELVPAERALIADVPTESLEAYRLFLRAKESLDRAGSEPEDLTTAETYLTQAIEEDPEFALAYAPLSSTHSFLYLLYDRAEARLAAAGEMADEALRLEPNLPDAWSAKAFELYHRYQNEEAAEALARAEAGFPGSADILALKAELLTRNQEWDAVLETRERAVLLDPRNPDLALNLAAAYAEADRWDEAHRIYEEILERDPTFYAAAFQRGWLAWLRTGDGRLGLEALAQIPDEVGLLGLKDFFRWLLTPDTEGKIDALESIRTPISEFGGFWWAPREFLVGWTYQEVDPARAERELREAVDISLEALKSAPRDPRIHVTLGRIYACLGLRDEAIREAELAVGILPISRDPVLGRIFQETASIIYAQLGMAEEAASGLEAVVSIPGVPPISTILSPEFDQVRDHPRIQAILQRYGTELGGSRR